MVGFDRYRAKRPERQVGADVGQPCRTDDTDNKPGADLEVVSDVEFTEKSFSTDAVEADEAVEQVDIMDKRPAADRSTDLHAAPVVIHGSNRPR